MGDIALVEGNNELDIVLQPIAPPEGYDVTLGVSNLTPEVLEVFQWWADITNLGSVPATPTIEWYKDGSLFNVITFTFNPGQTFKLYASSTNFGTPGIHTLGVSVDGVTDEVELNVGAPVTALATIEGQVTDYVNPLPNIRVLLSEYIDATWSFLYDTYTDADGFYRFTDIPIKKYRVYCDSYGQGYWAPGKDVEAIRGINTVDFRLTPLP